MLCPEGTSRIRDKSLKRNTLRVRSLYDTVEHAEQFEVNTYKQKDK
jgi:hypothetical protein